MLDIALEYQIFKISVDHAVHRHARDMHEHDILSRAAAALSCAGMLGLATSCFFLQNIMPVFMVAAVVGAVIAGMSRIKQLEHAALHACWQALSSCIQLHDTTWHDISLPRLVQFQRMVHDIPRT